MKNRLTFESTILVVDDELPLLEVIKETIGDYFSSIIVTDRGEKALELLKAHRIDCVITDYRMPGMNGLELISEIQKIYPSLPIILLTGNGSDKDVVSSLEKGLFDYVDKPFKSAVLINRIRNALLLPKLENLVTDLIKAEFSDLEVNRFLHLPNEERLRMIYALEAVIHTRLLVKQGKKGA